MDGWIVLNRNIWGGMMGSSGLCAHMCYVLHTCIQSLHQSYTFDMENSSGQQLLFTIYECFDNFKSKTPRPMTLYPRMVEEMIGADGNKKIVDVQDKSARATVDIIFLYII